MLVIKPRRVSDGPVTSRASTGETTPWADHFASWIAKAWSAFLPASAGDVLLNPLANAISHRSYREGIRVGSGGGIRFMKVSARYPR